MAADQDDDAQVTYSVKDLLASIASQQAAGFAEIKTALLQKADKSDVQRLEGRLNEHARHLSEHDHQLASLAQQQHDDEVAANEVAKQEGRVWSRRKVIWATVTGFVGYAILVVGPYALQHWT